MGSAGFEVRLLGTVELACAGVVLPLGSAKQQALLGLLALEVGNTVPYDTVVEELWGASPPASVAVTVQSLVSRLRATLRSAGHTTPAIDRSHAGYVLLGEPAWIDLHRFADLARAGRNALEVGNPAVAAESLRAALACWRGRALAGADGGPAGAAAAARLESARLDAVEALGRAELERGAAGDALALLEPEAAANPLREDIWVLLMRASYAAGRQADALAAYRRLRRTLADELGVEPGPAAREIHQRILKQDLTLRHDVLRSGTVTYRQTPTDREDTRREGPGAPPLPAPLTSFIGRAAELAELAAAVRRSRLVTIAGPGGSGKTRLALTFAERLDAAQFPDGAWLADLTPMSDPTLLAAELTGALGLQLGGVPDAGDSMVDSLCRFHRFSRRPTAEGFQRRTTSARVHSADVPALRRFQLVVDGPRRRRPVASPRLAGREALGARPDDVRARSLRTHRHLIYRPRSMSFFAFGAGPRCLTPDGGMLFAQSATRAAPPFLLLAQSS